MCTYRRCLLPLSSFSIRVNAFPKLALLLVLLQLLNVLVSGQLVVPSSQGSPPQSSPSNESLSSNALKDYVIYSVVDGPSRDTDNERIRLHLGMILAPADVQEYGGEYTGVEFWRVKMSDMQRTAFARANPKVCPNVSLQNLVADKCESPKSMRTGNFCTMRISSDSRTTSVKTCRILKGRFLQCAMESM